MNETKQGLVKTQVNDGIEEVIIQPDFIFNLKGIKDREDARKVLDFLVSYLIYMKVGNILETADARFKKIGEDLVQIDHCLDLNQLADNMEKRKIVRLPT